jgi:hypothetical protein
MSKTHPHLPPRLKKEQSYTSTPSLGLHGLFYGELDLSPLINSLTNDIQIYLPLIMHHFMSSIKKAQNKHSV